MTTQEDLTDNFDNTPLPDGIDRAGLETILHSSLYDDDFYCRESRLRLGEKGFEPDACLMMLAKHKSSAKYGYDIAPSTITHLLDLAKTQKEGASMRDLVESPFFLMKASWLYEHAPYFFFCDRGESKDRDSLITGFARKYQTQFLDSHISIEGWEKVDNPRQLMVTTFWESKTFDPLLIIERVKSGGFAGLEFNVDFHPFNYTCLLPEEISGDRRDQMREACRRAGISIDIHSPIVGPYVPSPDPARGSQRFNDPTQCAEIQAETIELAKDIGAGSVVVHLVDTSNWKGLAALIEKAAGSSVRVTVENYPSAGERQTSSVFIECVHEICGVLPPEIRKHNFGVTLDVGHLNIEGEDPLVGAERIGRWCLDNDIFLRMHATDNYGDLLFSPPAHSADVHSNVSGRGINNGLVIEMLRSMGHQFDVVAEQIHPLTRRDIETIHNAQTLPLGEDSYRSFVDLGKERLSNVKLATTIEPEVMEEEAYQFLVGIEGVNSLREYLVYRTIQDHKHLSVEEAKQISQDFMKMPQKLKHDLTSYMDDLLLPIHSETGSLQKNELDLISQNISGALFGTINNERLNQIFSEEIVFKQGEIICEQDKPGREMFFVKQGGVDVYIGESYVASLKAGEIFGEMSLFYNVNRSATIKAAADGTRIGVLSREGLESILRGSRPYAQDLIYRLYTTLPARLRNLNDKYMTAIRTLHLLFHGSDEDLPQLFYGPMNLRGTGAEYIPTLSQAEVNSICQEVRTFDRDQLVFAEGEKGDGAYLIMEGRVKVVSSTMDSREILLAELGVGEIFGELALIDEKPRSASVVTISPCKIGFVEKEVFNRFIQKGSGMSLRLMGFVCLSLFRRILRLDRLYSDIKEA